MRSISAIKWTEERIDHIAIHSVTPQEVEEVCFNEKDLPLIRSGRDKLHYVFGKTVSGRFLFIVCSISETRRGAPSYGQRYECLGKEVFQNARQIK